MSDFIGAIILLTIIIAIIGVGEGLRRWQDYSPNFTRKVIHIGVGMTIWLVPILFQTPWYFVGAALAFAVINFFDWKYGFLASMASMDESNLGTVYFPIAAAVVALIFWNSPPLMVAALMPLTWGDGLASVVGKTWGQHPYKVWGHTRTWEGSLAFLLATGLTVWLALWLVNAGIPAINTPFSPATALLPAAIIALTTTVAEAISIGGLDNLTVTGVALLVLSLI
jgi:phytol kinase